MAHHHLHHLAALLWHVTWFGFTARVILRWIGSFMRSIFSPSLAKGGFRIMDNYPLNQDS